MSLTIKIPGYQVTCHDDRVWQRVIDNEDDWLGNFYDLLSLDDIADHLAYNIGDRDCSLSQLEGWADLPNDAVSVKRI